MRTVLATTIAIVLLAACGKSSDTDKRGSSSAPKVSAETKRAGEHGEAHPDDCQAVGDRTTTNALTQMGPIDDAAMRARLEKLARDTGHMLAVRCVADGWSVDAVKCGLAAKDPQLECRDQLSATQLKKLSDTIQELWTEGLSAP